MGSVKNVKWYLASSEGSVLRRSMVRQWGHITALVYTWPTSLGAAPTGLLAVGELGLLAKWWEAFGTLHCYQTPGPRAAAGAAAS